MPSSRSKRRQSQRVRELLELAQFEIDFKKVMDHENIPEKDRKFVYEMSWWSKEARETYACIAGTLD